VKSARTVTAQDDHSAGRRRPIAETLIGMDQRTLYQRYNETDRTAGADTVMKVRFWGTRGGIAVPGPHTLKYGGNTSCVEVTCGPHRLILDAGTGLRPLGEALVAGGTAVNADLLFSHVHLDHIIGLGFFAPLYKASTQLRLHAGHLSRDELRQALSASLSQPLMPDLLGAAQASIDFRAFQAGATLRLHPNLEVATAPLNHPGGATGYRIMWGGKSVTYVTDTEHTPGIPDANVARLAQGTDLLIYDSSFTDEELPSHQGWGHSTWQEGVRIADAAGVGRLVLFHHDSGRRDNDLDTIVAAAGAARSGTIAAAEGHELTV
jgi:phosphoribosyl 1,2-cyclic phosphodiesterase